MDINQIYNSECYFGLKSLPDKSVNCCITSPPYYGLRDYGNDKQIGLEETPEEYIKKLVDVFSEVRRVLTDDGTLWVNIGDSYNGSGKGGASNPDNASKYKQGTNHESLERATLVKQNNGCKPKDLIGIPWMLAFALRSEGWYLRQDIIWNKPNPMPESVRDRCTKSHEYIFLLSKSSRYYFNQESIRVPLKDASILRLAQDIENQEGSSRVPNRTNGKMKAVCFGGNKYGESEDIYHRTKSGKEWNPHMAGGGIINNCGRSGYFDRDGKLMVKSTANKKSVWTVTTKPFKEAHFATFPEKLIIDCIKSGCPDGGLVLDPFMGSGTTAIVARKLNRNYIGFELNPEYITIAKKRIEKELGIFK